MNPRRSACARLLLAALLLAAITVPAPAQRDINIWYFGNRAGLDFNIPPGTPTTPAEVTTSAMAGSEGSALVTDRATGALLFYTNGIQVFDRNNAPMPGATGASVLGGGGSSTQAAIVVPDPGNPNLYFIFTTPDQGLSFAEFSIVDMTQRGGLGDVTVRRQPLPTLGGTSPPARVCEKVAATRDAAGTGFWILFHEFTPAAAGANAIYAYHLSNTGIDAVQVSNVGTAISNNPSFARGEMKVSPDGTWLATANETQVAELFRFNNATGAVTFVATLDAGQQHYGVSFSPNSRLLYINDGWVGTGRNVDQFDLSDPIAGSILASRVRIGTSTAGNLGGMQIGPDGRIYCAHNSATTLSVINCPNVPGTGCNFVDVGFTFTGGRSSSWGLPNLILESVITPSFAGRDTAICAGGSVTIGLTPLAGHTYLWNADPTLSDPNVARPVVTPTATTSYPLRITTPHGCIERDTITVTVLPLPAVTVSPDTAICDGESVQLNAGGGVTFQWSPVAGLSDPNIANPVATPTATTTYSVRVINAATCSDSAQVTVTVNPKPTVDAGSDTAICEGESHRLVATASPGVAFLWSPATGLDNPAIATPTATPAATTAYTVIVTNATGCRDTSTVTITVAQRPTALVSPDIAICAGDTTTLVASGGPVVRWEPATGLGAPNSANTTASPAATTTYRAIVTSGAGCSDTASVTVTVNPGPVAVVASSFDTVCNGQSVRLNASGGTRFQWRPATGLSDPAIADPIASPTTSTVYTVIVTDQNGCRDSADVSVTVVTPSIRLAFPDTVADPHTRGFRLPIRLQAGALPVVCSPDSFTVEFEFNASLFFPNGVSRGTITRNDIVNGRRVVAISFPSTTSLASGSLTELLGDILLGDSSSTPLLFRSITFSGLTVTTDSTHGRLTLLPICVEGGERLLDFGEGFGVTKIVPNPSGSEVTVEVRTVELGVTRLGVYSSNGVEVVMTQWVADRSAESGGETRRIALPGNLPSGLYQVVLTTPARRDVKSLIIVK